MMETIYRMMKEEDVKDDIYEDAQLLHKCMTRKIKRDAEEDSDYDPDNQSDDGVAQQSFATVPQGRYFQKPTYHCPECSRAYKSPVRLGNHLRDKHPHFDEQQMPRSKRSKHHHNDDTYHSPDISPSPSPPSHMALYPLTTDKHAHKDGLELFRANEHSHNSNNNSPHTTTTTTTTSTKRCNTPNTSSPSSPKESGERKVTVHGRTYDCQGVKISNVSDEIRFVESLETNKKRLQLANVALSQGLITPEEYAIKQREFINAFTFF